jgi:CIC family chloride channel protein
MSTGLSPGGTSETDSAGLFALALLSLLSGAVIGLVVGCFRLALEQLDAVRAAVIAWAHHGSVTGFPLVVGMVAVAAALAAWLVRRSGQPAAGSGIPHVEAVLKGELPAAPVLLFPVKFIGGLLAIGGGLALGREGPCVQIGANLASFWGATFRLRASDRLALLAAGAGAGLATAFNAPIAGAVFVLEELVRRFDTRIAVAALGASSAAIAMAALLIGRQPDFQVMPLPQANVWTGLLFGVLGVVAGFAGVAYNRTIIGACALVDGLTRWRPEVRALAIGALVGTLAWFAPDMVGGGDTLTQLALAGGAGLAVLPIVFLVRFLLGPLSYAAGTPGGLFAPILVLGASLGLAFGLLCQYAPGDTGAEPVAYAVVGMAAFFTATVRAPVTGIILVIELTGASTQLLPMLWACFAAMAVPTLFGSAPIYDSLRARTVRIAEDFEK